MGFVDLHESYLKQLHSALHIFKVTEFYGILKQQYMLLFCLLHYKIFPSKFISFKMYCYLNVGVFFESQEQNKSDTP